MGLSCNFSAFLYTTLFMTDCLRQIVYIQHYCLYTTNTIAKASPDRKLNSMSTIEERVKNIIGEQLGVEQEEVTNNASFVEDLGADSLDTVELVMALEAEFDTEIPDEEAEKITTVQAAIDYINSHQA